MRRGAADHPSPQTLARLLPFKGRLVDGDPNELPPAVVMSLSSTSPVEFRYREELTHDEYHIPLIFSAIDPVTYVGAPLGDEVEIDAAPIVYYIREQITWGVLSGHPQLNPIDTDQVPTEIQRRCVLEH